MHQEPLRDLADWVNPKLLADIQKDVADLQKDVGKLLVVVIEGNGDSLKSVVKQHGKDIEYLQATLKRYRSERLALLIALITVVGGIIAAWVGK